MPLPDEETSLKLSSNEISDILRDRGKWDSFEISTTPCATNFLGRRSGSKSPGPLQLYSVYKLGQGGSMVGMHEQCGKRSDPRVVGVTEHEGALLSAVLGGNVEEEPRLFSSYRIHTSFGCSLPVSNVIHRTKMA